MRMRNEENVISFITGNRHKYDEILKLFKKERFNLVLQQEDIETVEIQADNLKDVALFKLNSVKQKIKGSFFIEDSGFFIDSPLNGFPGVYSSYVMKTLGNEGILNLISDFSNTKARFGTIIALYYNPLNKIFTFEGEVNGKISKTMRGKSGFGFDPIFIPNELPDNTFAELSISEKNKISHRGKALKKLMNFLKESEEKRQ